MRENQLFMRNSFETQGKYNLPLIKKQTIDTDDIDLIAFSDTSTRENVGNRKRVVHFFIDDYRFERVYNNPNRYIERLKQYKYVGTPDFSVYSDMNYWRQLENTAKNRWCGAFWQSQGITVIPTISWGTARTFEFCFDGVEQGSAVMIGMIGSKSNKRAFLFGYNEMLKRINPEAIICFGEPFPEMDGNLIKINYLNSRRINRDGR